MKMTISFKNIEHTESLDEKIKEKTARLEKYLGGKTEIKWTCSAKEGNHNAEIKLLGPQIEYHASASSENLYKTLDLAVNKIEKQLAKQKDKWRSKIRKKENLTFLEPENAWTDYDEDNYSDVA